ncbi:MAG: (4Fe-4S)-binding protein [Balneolales bacterium]|nr:(4Fe-4S)-binding protein [Balneolales bacterium]
MDKKNIIKEYTNGEVTIVWQAAKCIHSANCVKNNPDVFQPKTRPWIKPDASSTEKIISTINTCPSGALTYYMNDADGKRAD